MPAGTAIPFEVLHDVGVPTGGRGGDPAPVLAKVTLAGRQCNLVLVAYGEVRGALAKLRAERLVCELNALTVGHVTVNGYVAALDGQTPGLVGRLAAPTKALTGIFLASAGAPQDLSARVVAKDPVVVELDKGQTAVLVLTKGLAVEDWSESPRR